MKRTLIRAVATASSSHQTGKNSGKKMLIALIAAAAVCSGESSAQAFGGHGGFINGERVISSQVVSDTVVGESSGGEVTGQSIGDGSMVGGGVQNREYGQPDLFYNFYTQGGANSANAQMYVAPVPVPPNVGHTFYTYQPFYPHEMLYKHTDRFHNYYDNGRGMNRTRVSYSYPPVKTAVSNFYWNVLRIPR